MTRLKKTDLAYMQELVGGLSGKPTKLGSHPFGIEGIEILLARVVNDVDAPDEVKQRLRGSEPVLGLLGLMALDCLMLRLPRCKRDRPLVRDSGTGRREKLRGEEQDAIGLNLFWFKDIETALESAESLSWGDAINETRKGLRGFVTSCELADPDGPHLGWMVPLLLEMFQQGRSGEKSASNYCNRALLLILQRIEHYVDREDMAIGDVLPGLSGDEPEIEFVALGRDWDESLSHCVADYRAYELREIERLLGEQGLSPSFDWFLPRRAYRLAEHADLGEETPTVELVDICRPGLRTALLDHRGSGTTAALLWLSYRWCNSTADIVPVVLRLDAKDYKDHAANRSPVQYLARRLYGIGSDSRLDRARFKDVLDETEVICLIDNLARVLPRERQGITQWLGDVSGLVVTSKWISDDALSDLGGEGAVRVALRSLDATAVQQFITKFAERSGPDFDAGLARHIAVRELPETARLPLGLRIICERVQVHDSNCASVMKALISELFQGGKVSPPEWDQSLSELPDVILTLMQMAVKLYRTRAAGEDIGSFWIDKHWAKGSQQQGQTDDQGLSSALKSPLVARTGQALYRFLNREVLGFLVALDSIERRGECNWFTSRCALGGGIEGVTNRHYLALLEQAAVGH